MPFFKNVILMFEPGHIFLGVKSMVIVCAFKTIVELTIRKKVSKILFILL